MGAWRARASKATTGLSAGIARGTDKGRESQRREVRREIGVRSVPLVASFTFVLFKLII